MHNRPRRAAARAFLVLLAVLALSGTYASSASAEALVNGGFETGNLSGWKAESLSGAGEWFAIEAAEEELDPPFSGRFLAIAAEEELPDRMTMSQEVALAPNEQHVLSGTVGYESSKPMVTPSPNTLLIQPGVENQQLRVDVLRAGASLTSVAPGDVLATLFATQSGDPQSGDPRRFQVDLSSFAGQSVVLRAVNVVNDGLMEAFVDDFSISGKSGPPLPPAPVLPPPPAPSNVFTKGKLKLNKEEGTAKLTITVPGPGVVKAVDAKKRKKVVKGAGVTAKAAGSVVIPIKPTGRGLKALNSKGKLPFKVRVSFTPTGGTASTQPATGMLKLQG